VNLTRKQELSDQTRYWRVPHDLLPSG
jgi:hypothetical protein